MVDVGALNNLTGSGSATIVVKFLEGAISTPLRADSPFALWPLPCSSSGVPHKVA